MPGLHATTVVIDDGQVLLIQREDFKVWCLPGGQVESGESVAQAAIREVKEETGINVELLRLVGIYFRPQWPEDSHSVVFAAKPIGGTLRPQKEEADDVRYFDPLHLPDLVIWWHRQQIQDALHGVGGSEVWTQNAVWPFPPNLTRQQIYDMRDRGELSLSDLYDTWCHFPKPGEQVQEIE